MHIRPILPIAWSAIFSLAATLNAQDDWVAPTGTTILNTSIQKLRTKQNRTVTFVDGVFVLRNVTIPSGARVEVQGPRPILFVVTGSFRVDGVLAADGRDGQASTTLGGANFPVGGGAPGPGGGAGGDASSNTIGRTLSGSPGEGPYRFPAFGGGGGSISIGSGARLYGAGGGGGVFGTVGDKAFAPLRPALGFGGDGMSSAGRYVGGRPGRSVFVDKVVDNDFWGVGYDVFHKRVVVGELPILIGGSGGGGGGDRSSGTANWIQDGRGGAGGGGGGCIAIYAFGKIRVGGKIHCNGGSGGGGQMAGSSTDAGGGGGGSGGMLVLMTRDEIVLEVRGETFDRGDSDFCLAADGALSRQLGFGVPKITSKYGSLNGLRPNSGGFGGLGLLQLMAPIGTNADKTNTVFDDRITLMRGNTKLTGADKQRYLAWRGWANAKGQRIDDSGKRIAGTRGGDTRPSPVLLPIF